MTFVLQYHVLDLRAMKRAALLPYLSHARPRYRPKGATNPDANDFQG
jgi:hypothetical protein